MPKVLIIEDDKVMATTLKRFLEAEAFEGVEDYVVELVDHADAGLARARNESFDVVITDLHLQGDLGSPDGLRIINDLHAAKPQLPIILMTADSETRFAIEAIKLGAYEYVLKEAQQFVVNLLSAVTQAVDSYRRMSEPVGFGHATTARHAIIGTSRVMQQVYKDIGRFAATPVTVLVQGETGTGKELVARALQQHSSRKDQPYVTINCVAIPETLLESELFGHERGAFTGADVRRIGRFEQAHGGTIFLDEIGDMTSGTQAKLLRVLQEKSICRLGSNEVLPVDIRIIAATHRDLPAAIKENKFREDLYYRLNVAAIHLPPLRDRPEDIPALLNHFIQRFALELGAAVCGIRPEAIVALQQHPWPGNVRELENVVAKFMLLAHGQTITADIIHSALGERRQLPSSLDQTISQYVGDLLHHAARGDMKNVETALTWDIGYELYRQAIDLARGNQVRAARWLGVSRPTMRKKLALYGLLGNDGTILPSKSGNQKNHAPPHSV